MRGKGELFIRKETYPNEHRTPLTPSDVGILIRSGFSVFVERSEKRVYKDEEYEKEGATLTPFPWNFPYYKSCLILGLKELENIEILDQHSHAYFSHSFKQQRKSNEILRFFSISNSKLYDFEYFLDKEQRRIISFGFFAGCVGGILGILQFYKNLAVPLKPWNSFEGMIEDARKAKEAKNSSNPKIAIIGYKGRCGQGVQKVLELLGLSFCILDRSSDPSTFKDYDIFYNCITLEETYQEVWFHEETEFSKSLLIVDISCDATKVNQPIQIYSQNTTWDSPIYSYNSLVDILAIDNLPSLLPRESSAHFSSVLLPLLLNKEEAAVWKKTLDIFMDVTRSPSQ
jgi:saccharopine dehydrogenase (NAD+, L-lysine-forming)